MNLKDLKSLALLAMTTAISAGTTLSAEESNPGFSSEKAFLDCSQHALYRTTGCCSDKDWDSRRTYDSHQERV
jgi:hypothetical protein